MKGPKTLGLMLLAATGLLGLAAPAASAAGLVRATRVSPRGVAFLKSEEGFRDKAYADAAGNYTIGYGHKIVIGDGLNSKSVITPAQAEALLIADLAKAEKAVALVGKPLTQNQYDALTSLAYNIGAGAFRGSTLLQYLNAGNYGAAANEFLVWKNAGGKPILLGRRERERNLFLGA